MVSGYEDLISAMTNDPGDRHVLAAAVRRHAGTIVTNDRTGFAAHARQPYGIDVHTPDEFLLGLWDLSPPRMLQALADQAARLNRPAMTVRDLVERLMAVVPAFADVVLDSDIFRVAKRQGRDRF